MVEGFQRRMVRRLMNAVQYKPLPHDQLPSNAGTVGRGGRQKTLPEHSTGSAGSLQGTHARCPLPAPPRRLHMRSTCPPAAGRQRSVVQALQERLEVLRPLHAIPASRHPSRGPQCGQGSPCCRWLGKHRTQSLRQEPRYYGLQARDTPLLLERRRQHAWTDVKVPMNYALVKARRSHNSIHPNKFNIC